jgi:hypothetical protein
MYEVGIVVEAWKLSIFERHLKQSGYVFTDKGPMPGAWGGGLLLTVKTENPTALAEVVKAAQAEANATGEQDIVPYVLRIVGAKAPT